MAKPHAHVMLTMRSVDEDGFGPKMREWNATQMVERWRERLAALANERLAELDIDARIDHRSLEDQGIVLEPKTQIGAPAQRIEGEGIEAADRAELHREISRGNPRPDGRHGAEPGARSATRIPARQPQEVTRHQL